MVKSVVKTFARWIVFSFLIGLGSIALSEAHEGPPYPVIVDQITSFGTVSVWADPDVGGGQFIILIEPLGDVVHRPPKDLLIDVSAKMKSPTGNEEAIQQRAQYSTDQAERSVFLATLPFSAEGLWNVRFAIAGSSSESRSPSELAVDVEVTPPGPSRAEFLIYAIPFVLLGLLWAIAIVKSKRNPRLGSK